MRLKRMAALAAILMALVTGAVIASSQPPKVLVLTGGMLLDGYEVPPVHHATVVIEGNRIVDAGPTSRVRIPSGAAVIDTRGMTMMPGLIDLHAHLMILGHGDYGRWFPWVVKHGVERVMEISARQLVHAGVTSAVDLAGPLKESLSIRERIGKGEIPGPRMFVSGPWLTRTLGSYPPEMRFQRQVTTAEEAAAAAADLIKAGVDVIKLYPLSLEQYKAVVGVARQRGVKVHAHVYSPANVADALDAGVDVLQHVGSAGTPPYAPDLLRAIVESGRPVVPTAAHRAWIYPLTVQFPERLQDPRLRRDFPPDILKEVEDSLENWHTLGYFQTTDRQMFHREGSIRQWIESGAVVGIGTDSGTPMNFHTEAMWQEMKAFVDSGMSPQRAISAATRINARILGRARDLGTIEPGKLADLIVVQGSPLVNVMALDQPVVVVKDGHVVKNDLRRD